MIHITPIDDLKEHEQSTTCLCNPKIKEENGEIIVTHNSYDGREAMEELNEILQITDRVQYDVIKTNCPLTYAALKDRYDDPEYGLWLSPGYLGCLCYWEGKNGGCLGNRTWQERKLYDFFDGYNLFAHILLSRGIDNGEIKWVYCYSDLTQEYENTELYDNRKEAETACFNFLFSKLEELLSQ